MSLLKRLIYPTAAVRPSYWEKCFRGKWIVITGASHGIGKELAYRLIDAKANLFLIARTVTELEQISADAHKKNCACLFKAMDLRNRADLDSLCEEAVFPQEDVADPLAELWTKEAVLNLLLNDII